jgi:hypothetical protein
MTTYNTGYPYSNLVAVPPVACKPYEIGARVRMAYGKIVIPASSVPGTGSVINVTKLPLDSFIIAVLAKWEDLNDSTHSLQLFKGTDAISADNDVGTAQAAYAFDYTGSGQTVDTEAERIISATITGAALNGTAGNKFECIILYAHD